MLVNAILVKFGLSEEMHNPVAIFALVGIVLAGAALGYWIVRKFVISKDGNVDASVSQFVKWAMRVIATTFILQGTLDTPLAVGTLISCFTISFLITSARRRCQLHQSYSKKKSPKQSTSRNGHAEFLSRPLKMSPRSDMWNSSRSSPAWYNSPVRGVVSPSVGKGAVSPYDYYSTFHKTPNRKRFTKEDWEDFTQESTREAVAGLVTSPEFTDWIIEHADRIHIHPDESSDEAEASESDSIDEITLQDGNWFAFFSW
ncbi:uncharacterized protein LOC110807792 [Carica papaya]|uniref:uncharacterized protein LOC110807792 n=1 Tax=Carica papaya TaxID=3649 RepID=UPI000B8C92B8|nr:uncharacterized protein LOC110807792 [Carica papaya]